MSKPKEKSLCFRSCKAETRKPITSQLRLRIRYSPLSRQKTGLNKIVSGAVFKRGAAAPPYIPSSRSEEGSQGRRELFFSSRSSAQPLDGRRSVGYSARAPNSW